jgi:two-component system OmpR family sensor kinase
MDMSSDLPSLQIDGARMEEACSNLIANALQHSPSGSVVRVGGRVEPNRSPPSVLLAVEDEGPGLPAEETAA